MKKALFLLVLGILMISGCSTDITEISGNNHRTPEYSDDTLQTMKEYVGTFASAFPRPFSATHELDSGDIAFFAFWQIYYDDSLVANSAGTVFISDERLRGYIKANFGIEGYEYNEPAPTLDVALNGYHFYPVGELSRFKTVVTDEAVDNDQISFTVEITEQKMDNLAEKETRTLKYQFNVKAQDGKLQLVALNSTAS